MYPKRVHMDGLHTRLGSYRDRRARALIKTFYFWLHDMSRSDRRAWATRGAQIISKIDNARTISLKDKSGLDSMINYEMDREEARFIVRAYHKPQSDDEYSS